jgi:hypothetical protein
VTGGGNLRRGGEHEQGEAEDGHSAGHAARSSSSPGHARGHREKLAEEGRNEGKRWHGAR